MQTQNIEQLETIDQLCRNHVEKALRMTKGNLRRAGAMIGVPKSTLFDWCASWGIKPGEFKEEVVLCQQKSG